MHTIIKIAVVLVLALFAIVKVVNISNAQGTSVFFDNGKIALTDPIHYGYTNHFLNPFIEVQLHLLSPRDARSDYSRGLVVYKGNAWMSV